MVADFSEILFPCIIKKINFRPYLCGGLWILLVSFQRKELLNMVRFLFCYFLKTNSRSLFQHGKIINSILTPISSYA